MGTLDFIPLWVVDAVHVFVELCLCVDHSSGCCGSGWAGVGIVVTQSGCRPGVVRRRGRGVAVTTGAGVGGGGGVVTVLAAGQGVQVAAPWAGAGGAHLSVGQCLGLVFTKK